MGENEIETVEPKDARVPVAANDMFVLDVHSEEDWSDDAEQIPGSVHIPAEELDSRMDELPEDTKILVVCPDGELSAEVAGKLAGEGDREIVALEGGVEAWRKARLMTQPSPDAAGPKAEGADPVETAEDSEDSEDSD